MVYKLTRLRLVSGRRLWRGGRAVEGSGLENRRRETYRGFESHLLRSQIHGKRAGQLFVDKRYAGEMTELAEGARLLSECRATYRGFESLSLRRIGSNALVAQLDRAVVYETTGQRFESSWAY